jgi:hypothetical protein
VTRIAAVVAPNGVGHLRRVTAVLDRLVEQRPDVGIDLLCATWQIERLRDTPSVARLLDRDLRVVSGIVDPGIRWTRDAASLTTDVLLGWEGRLAGCAAVRDATLVISDNLVGALTVRPDAVLMGSFLWSDVLEAAHPGHAAVAELVDHDRALLDRFRPPMLCVGDLAMPGVLARTDAVTCGWMCAAPPVEVDRSAAVAFLGGATGEVDGLLAAVASRAAGDGQRVASPFGFRPEDFAALAAVVCRPGVGTMTDCVAQGTPMVTVRERGNVELDHNATRVSDLGIARDAGADPTPVTVLRALGEVVDPGTAASMRAAASRLDRDGLRQAAAWLVERLP